MTECIKDDNMDNEKEEVSDVAVVFEAKSGDDDNDDDDDVDDDDDNDGSPSFEKVLECLGMPGRYQIVQLVLAKVTLVTVSFMVFSIVFTGHTPYHECKKVNDTELINQYTSEHNTNVTSAHVFYDSCDIKITLLSNQSNNIKTTTFSRSCPNGRDFFSAVDTSYNTEWDLVCESKWKVEFTHASLTIGQIIGGLISSPTSDRFGRKPVFVIASCLCCLIEVAHIFAPGISIVYIIRFFSGLAAMAAVTCGTILSIELVVPRHRQIVSVAYHVGGVCTSSIVRGVAYFVQDKNWRYFHGVSIGTGFIAFLTPFILKESPRWLVANQRFKEALDIFKIACRQNGKDFEILQQKFNAYIEYEYSTSISSVEPLVIKTFTINSDKENGNFDSLSREITISPNQENTTMGTHWNESTKKPVSTSQFHLLCHRRLLILMVVSWYLWLTNVLTYYGLYITSSVLAGNRFLNFILMGVVELPGLALVLYMMNKLGRRVVFGVFMGSTGLCLMVSALMSTVGENLSGSETVVAAMFILGKFSITASFAVLYVITPEMFPTNVRTTAHGFSSALGRLGSMVAPFMRLFHDEVRWGPALVFTVMSFGAVLVSLYLPETKDKDLPTTLEDMIGQIKSKKVKNSKKTAKSCQK